MLQDGSLCKEYDFMTNKVFFGCIIRWPFIFAVLFAKYDDDVSF